MGDIKNPFDFGTGSIDKDQWQRDIDNEQDAFITRYQNATSRKNGLLLRQAFQELRKRIANGDMLNRTADGLYQFGSALNREDKGMEEAYRRALGFMGDLARRQINTPQPAPQDEKKVYSPTLLNSRFIKSINPSGTFDISFWNGLDDAKRVAKLKAFVEEEKNNLKNYNGVESYDSLLNLELRMQAFLNTPDVENLNRLGFTKNYLSLILSDDASQTQPLTEGELLDALLALQLLERENLEKRDRINYGNNSQVVTYNFDTPRYDIQADIINQTKRLTPGLNLSGIPQTQNWNTNYTNQLKLYVLSSTQELSDYFNNFRVNYQSILSNKNNIPTLSRNLARLFATIPGKEQGTTLQVYDWSKYLTHLPNGGYMINGTLENNGRFLYYNPSKGILHTNIARMDLSTYDFLRDLALLKSGYMKDGGVIKGQNGLDFSTVSLNTPLPLLKVEETPKSKEDENQGMTTADWVNILGPVTLDIGSMLSANVPGYGTLVSGITGLGSTIWSGINDASKGQFSALGTLSSLGADAFGLVPGWGMSAKVGKVASKFLRYSKPIMYAFTAKGLTDAGKVFSKGLNYGFDSLDRNDWELLAAGFTLLMGGAAKGTAAVKRSNIQEMRRASASKKTFNYIDDKGEIKPKTVGLNDNINGELRVSRPKIYADKEGVINGRVQALDGFNANYGIASNKRFGMLYNQAKQGNVPLHSWETWEWKVPRIINTDKAKQQLAKLRNSLKPKQETSKTKESSEAKLKKDTKKKTSKAQKKEIGGTLKALRNGGIIKGQWGIPGIQVPDDRPLFFTAPETQEVQVPIDPNASTRINTRQTYNFGNSTPTFFIDLDITQNKLDAARGTGLIRSRYSVPAPNGKTLLNYKSAMDALLNYYNTDSGKNIMGDVYNYYNTWKQANPDGNYNDFITDYNGHVNNIRNKQLTKFALDDNGNPVHKVNEKGWSDFNDEHYMLYPSYGKFTDKEGKALNDYNKDQKDIFGESTWRRLPNSFNGDEMDELRRGFLKLGDNTSYIHMKDDGTLEIVEPPKLNVNGIVEGGKKDAVEKVDPLHTEFTPKFGNPIDPSLGIIAAKTAAGLMGNRNVYLNLLDEMPQAPLRDPLNRQLAIVGWQERVKNGQNQLADLRRVLQMQQGADQQANFATALDAERIGRDIMDKAFLEDSGRQFETAQKLWNLKNEDTMYNIGVGDANRKSIADRARMMAQIRAAWRSGDSNIIMGSIADTGNWLMKKYQREQDLVDKAKELSLGSIDQYAEQELANDTKFKTRWSQLKAKQTAGTLTDAERQEIEQMKANKMQEIRGSYAGKYYGLYHTPLFGGGVKETISHKDGGSLEKEKLRARGKDNDRYVSMIKDLRTTNYRRRRRR